ncbi:hypothetical protein [Rickettsia monacensis]|uniref:hypothetical protein n=1 Tax=Rickettsia monacensis TaxID=109232 RepID=UPI00397D0CCD
MRAAVGFVAWFTSLSVIPRLDRGIQLKILIILVFSVVFWIPWPSHGMTPNGFFKPYNKLNALRDDTGHTQT